MAGDDRVTMRAELDTTQFVQGGQQVIDALHQIGVAGKDAAKEIQGLNNPLKDLKDIFGDTALRSVGLGKQLDAIGKAGKQSSQQITEGFSKVSPTFDQLNEKLQLIRGSFQAGTSGVGGFVSSLGGVSSALLPIAAGVAALGVAFVGIKSSVAAAAEASDTMKRLDDAVKRTGTSVSQAAPQIEAAIQKIFDTSAYDDEPLRKAAATFVTITGNAQAAAAAIAPIADLAAAMGIDVESSANLIAKAAEGMTGALQRSGIIFSDTERKALATATAGDRLAMVFDKINQKVGGAAASELGTYAGQVANMKKQWGELAEAFGAIFLPAITNVMAGLADLAKRILQVGSVITDLIVTFKPFMLIIEAFDRLTGKNTGGASGSWDVVNPPPPDAAKGFDGMADAMAKARLEALGLEKQSDSLFDSLSKMVFDIEVTFAPPVTDPVLKAIAEVNDKIRKKLQEVSDKTREVTADVAQQTAQIAALEAGRAKVWQSDDPNKAATVAGLNKVIEATKKLRDADFSALDLLRQLPDVINAGGDAARQFAQENAIAEMAIKAREEFLKLQKQIEEIAVKGKQTIESLSLPSGLADSINAQIDKAKQDAQNLAITAMFFDPSVRADLKEAALDFQKAHTDGLTAGAKVLGDRLHKAAQELADAIDKFASDMADVFTAGVTGGAEGFAKAASKLFLQGVNDGAKQIFKSLALVAFGAPPERSQFAPGPLGDDDFVEATKESAKQQQAIMGAITGAVGALGETLSIFKNAKQGQEVSVLGTTLSFAATGASIGALFGGLGGVIGAVIGAFAGLTIALIANAKALKSMPYAAYGIRDGKAYVEPFAGKEQNFANVTSAMMNDMLSQMTRTLEDTRNDYVKLLMRFPEKLSSELIDGITAANFAPTMDTVARKKSSYWNTFKTALTGGLFDPSGGGGGIFGGHPFREDTGQKDTKGDIGNPLYNKNALKTFQNDFQNWVNNTLPKEIIATFEEPLAKGFAGLGLAADKFHTIWDRLQAIDPKDAIKSLNDLFDALTAFKETEKFLSQDIYGGKGFVFGGGLIEQARAANVQSFADKLAQADVALVQLGATFEQEIGPQQIADAKAWGDALLQREEAVKQFFQQVAQAIDNVIAGYQAKIRDLTLAGFKKPDGTPDVAAQVGYLKKYADTLWGQITKATTPEQVMQLSNELSNTISKIQQIGGAQSVEAAEAYRVWAIQQLQKAQDLVVAQLNKMAMDVAQQNQNFLDAIQGFIDAFLGATERLTGDSNQDQPPQTEIPPPPERHNEGPHRWIIKGQEDLFSLTGEDTYTPPQPGAAQSLYEPPEANQSRELMTMVVAGTQENVVYLKRIAVNQEQILAVLAEGRDLRVSADDMTIHIEDQAVTVPMSVDDGGFDRREVGSRGKRAT